MLLKSYMKTHKLSAYLINSFDEHINEYTGPSDNRMQQVSPFTVSQIFVLITFKRSYAWANPCSYDRAKFEVNSNFKLIRNIDKFRAIISRYEKIGLNWKHWSILSFIIVNKGFSRTRFEHHDVDHLYTLKKRRFMDVFSLEEKMMKDLFSEKDVEMVNEYYEWLMCDTLKVDLNKSLAGNSRIEKIAEVRDAISDDEILLVTELDEIAYLLNLRGCDITNNPVFFSFLLVSKSEVILFSNAQVHIDSIELRNYYSFYDVCSRIKQSCVAISHDCNLYTYDLIKVKKVRSDSTIRNMKSVKNPNEIFGFIMAHVYDGISLCALFEYVQKTLTDSSMTELEISRKLLEIKSKSNGFYSQSFETISASGTNTIVTHYEGTEKIVDINSLYLINPGTQYLFGTTDITRTLAFGDVTDMQKSDFTHLLKGQIDAITAVFNKKYSLSILAILPKLQIWKHTTVDDYEFATGHGVGHFLNVHETPPILNFVSKKKCSENMIFTIEPQLYRKNEYQIIIGDIVIVRSFNDAKYRLYNLTVVPLQMKLINFELLNKEHLKYIKEYNRRTKGILSRYMKKGDEGYEFLMQNTGFI